MPILILSLLLSFQVMADMVTDFAQVGIKLEKDRIYVVNFWATWCTSCIKEIPELNALKKSRTGENYHFLAVNSGEELRKINKFISRNPFDYDVVVDPKKELTRKLKIESLPMTLVIRNNEIVYQKNRPPQKLTELD